MTDLILHKSSAFIDEDRDYYFSGQRDVNNQIRPSRDIYSLTPDSDHLSVNFEDGKTGSLFFPIPPHSIDRIYIGISFPLFANNWGAAWIRYLLTRVKHDGKVIMPVYPEMQAHEKNYWSRSLLENIFLSRSRWKGISNISAENDGVMSIRVGRAELPVIKSSQAYYFEEALNTLYRRTLNQAETAHDAGELLINYGQKFWSNQTVYGVTERIIQDYFGRCSPVRLCDIGDGNGMIAVESLLSDYINVEHAVVYVSDEASAACCKDIGTKYHQNIPKRISYVDSSVSQALSYYSDYHVICVFNTFNMQASAHDYHELLASALESLAATGILIVYEADGLQDEVADVLDSYNCISHYSSIVASSIEEGRDISHYSRMLETDLAIENSKRQAVFRVIRRY